MPVGVSTVILPPPSGGGVPDGDIRTFFFTGLTERGDTSAPISARSFAEFVDRTGRRVTYGAAYDQAQAFFAEAGDAPARVMFGRKVGPAATKGTLMLKDAALAEVVRIDARDPGSYSSDVTVEVQAGLVAGTTTLLVSYLGGSQEKFANLADPAAIQTALLTSEYVRGTDLGVGTDPAVLAPTALSAGTDDRASVNAASLIAALALFPADLGPGIVAIPGQPYSTVAAGIQTHVNATGRIDLVATALGTSVAAAATAARGLRSVPGSERTGLAYPWVQIPDGAGGGRMISPEGAIAGRRAATINRVGPWHSPAADGGQFRFVTGVERALTADEINILTDDAVIPVRLTPGGIRLYGWRSLSADDTTFRSLTTMDMLNDLAFGFDNDLEEYREGDIDGAGTHLTAVKNKLIRRLGPVAEKGGLYANPGGNPPDPGYKVDVGPAVNTRDTLAHGQTRAQVLVRPTPKSEWIQIFLSAVSLTTDL